MISISNSQNKVKEALQLKALYSKKMITKKKKTVVDIYN
jgi:hypothetical protein